MIQHNLTIAFRNLWKYKLQTLISIASIAIGIVVLAVVHSMLQQFRLPAICGEPYYERAYTLRFDSIGKESADASAAMKKEIIKALKRDGGLRCAEGNITTRNSVFYGGVISYYKGDSIVLKKDAGYSLIDPERPAYKGMRSAITGDKIRTLKSGEAIISESHARAAFGNASPLGLTFALSFQTQSYNCTIVDVYRDISRNDEELDDRDLFVCLGLLEEDEVPESYCSSVDVVLREGCSVAQLEQEASARLKPMGFCAKAESVSERMRSDNNMTIALQTVGHLFGALILLAAIVGFLRMQLQLFWMRRHELSLRIVNGARRSQLFVLLMTEVCLLLGTALLLSVALDTWLNDTVGVYLAVIMEGDNLWGMDSRYLICLAIVAVLLLLCAAIVYVTLQRICRAELGLAQSMRRSRSHTFRNVMLGVQLAITVFFVCISFQFTQWAQGMCQKYNEPADSRIYKESFILNVRPMREGSRACRDAVSQLPDVAQFFPVELSMRCALPAAEDNKALKDRLQGCVDLCTFLVEDTTMLNYLGIRVQWFKQIADRSNCILVQEDMYRILQEHGAIDGGTLTLRGFETYSLPIAGTYDAVPFTTRLLLDQENFILISPGVEKYVSQYVVVPRKGRYAEVQREIEEIVQRMDPGNTIPMLSNYYETEAARTIMARNISLAVWALAMVSLLVSIMSVYSTIALDTRARRKEVAIRKINGAKGRDIVLLFGRLYLVLCAVVCVVVLPVAALFQKTVVVEMSSVDYSGSVVLPLLYGVAVVVLAVALIVGWQVRSIMRVNPADIIAKE